MGTVSTDTNLLRTPKEDVRLEELPLSRGGKR